MKTIRFREIVECSMCGADIALPDERHFALDEHAALCFACAVCRGGVYDDTRRQWLALPDTSGVGAVPEHTPRRYRAAG